jgi:hypothetical protein
MIHMNDPGGAFGRAQPGSADPGTLLKRRDPDHRGAGGFAHRPAPLFFNHLASLAQRSGPRRIFS